MPLTARAHPLFLGTCPAHSLGPLWHLSLFSKNPPIFCPRNVSSYPYGISYYFSPQGLATPSLFCLVPHFTSPFTDTALVSRTPPSHCPVRAHKCRKVWQVLSRRVLPTPVYTKCSQFPGTVPSI